MTVSITILTVASLGLPDGSTTQQILGSALDVDDQGNSAPFSLGRAQQLGLNLCPPAIAPEYRLAYKDQPIGEKLYVAMQPITSSDGEPRIFLIARSADGSALDAARARPDDAWKADDKFMFCMP